MRGETHSASRTSNLTHIVLSVTAIAGLVLFILACRPSWSPDGRKVVYSYWDDKAKESAVVVFDRKTRTSRLLLEWWDKTSSDQTYPSPQWTKDGERILVTTYENKGTQLLALPVNAKNPVRTYTLDKLTEPFLPYVQLGNTLFAMGESGIVRLDLETRELLERKVEHADDCLLYEAGNRVMYMRSVERESKESPEKKGSQGENKKPAENLPSSYELGEVDQKDLSFSSMVTLKSQELEARKLVDLTAMQDVEPRSLKFAAAEDSDKTKAPRIVVIGKSGIEQVLEVGIKEKPYALMNLQWSRDGGTIFAGAEIKDEKTKRSEFGVIEVPVDGKSIRIDRIQEGPTDEVEAGFISLSPDGKLIAVTTGLKKETSAEKRGLFLLDVGKAERPVSFYPAPPLPKVAKEK